MLLSWGYSYPRDVKRTTTNESKIVVILVYKGVLYSCRYLPNIVQFSGVTDSDGLTLFCFEGSDHYGALLVNPS